jgi:hypothetical protein
MGVSSVSAMDEGLASFGPVTSGRAVLGALGVEIGLLSGAIDRMLAM